MWQHWSEEILGRSMGCSVTSDGECLLGDNFVVDNSATCCVVQKFSAI
jgi:hypothetical protein